jgi:carbon monoxide dehydrogenase subunit G
MNLTFESRLHAPVEVAWLVLSDVARVAPCFPGAELQETDGETSQGRLKVKVGPITAAYAGTLRLTASDSQAYRMILHAQGRETRGQGNASAEATVILKPLGSDTQLTATVDLTITGRVAQFGRGVLSDVGKKLLLQFVDCVETRLADEVNASAYRPSPGGTADSIRPRSPVKDAKPTRTGREAAVLPAPVVRPQPSDLLDATPADSGDPSIKHGSALLIASDEYVDSSLRNLRSPVVDSGALADVLRRDDIGPYEVKTATNQPWYVVARAIDDFFSDRRTTDLLLLYFSCHGIRDNAGHLYFAMPDTKSNRLASSAISSHWVIERMERGRSKRVVLILDCCYSGAFAMGAKASSDKDLEHEFSGRGRVVLTAARAVEYAFEDGEADGRPSIFTSAIIDGLQSGLADRDGDGFVTVDELYDHVHQRVTATRSNQTPSKWAYGAEGALVVALSPRGAVPVPLPPEIREALSSPLQPVRAAMVDVLWDLTQNGSPGMALAARQALEQLTDDDSRHVSTKAKNVLAAGTSTKLG